MYGACNRRGENDLLDTKSGGKKHGCPWQYNIKKCSSKKSLSFLCTGHSLESDVIRLVILKL